MVLERRQMQKNSWIWIAAGWFFVVRVSEYHALRVDLGHELTWEGSLRYTLVELGFWLIMTPVMAWWAEKFPLERPALVKNVAVLLFLNVATELLYSSYRVKLHHFVYPDFAQHSFWHLYPSRQLRHRTFRLAHSTCHLTRTTHRTKKPTHSISSAKTVQEDNHDSAK